MNAQWNAPISDRFSSLCARVFSPTAAILESEKTLGTRLQELFLFTNMAGVTSYENDFNYSLNFAYDLFHVRNIDKINKRPKILIQV